MPLATEGTQEHIIIYCHAKTLGERRAARGRSPDERGGWERTLESGGVLGSGPEVEVFAGKNFTLGPDPELFGDGEDEGGEGHEHGGHGEEDARGGTEEGVAGLGLLGLDVDHIILL